MKTFSCDICNAPMELDVRLPNSRKNNVRNRYKCTLCDYKKVLYGSGINDEKYFPEQGVEEVAKKFKQEEENRK